VNTKDSTAVNPLITPSLVTDQLTCPSGVAFAKSHHYEEMKINGSYVLSCMFLWGSIYTHKNYS